MNNRYFTAALLVGLLSCSVLLGQEKPGDKLSLFLEAEGFEGVGLPGGWEVQASGEGSYSGNASVSIPQDNIKAGKNIEIVSHLKQPLPPGEYRVFVRLFQMMIGEEDSVMQVQLGDAPPQDVTWPISKRLRWQPPLTFRTTTPTSSIKLIPVKASGSSTGSPDAADALVKRIIVDTVLITTDPEWQVVELHRRQNKIDRPQAQSNSEFPPPPVREGNSLENASFEVGRGHGWGKIWIDQIDSTTAFDGKASVRLPVTPYKSGGDLGYIFQTPMFESKFYRVPPGRYTLSAWIKADKAGAKGRCSFGISSHPDDPEASGKGKSFSLSIDTMPTEWKRLTQTVDIPNSPGNFWSVNLTGNWRVLDQGFTKESTLEELRSSTFNAPSSVWIDAVQLKHTDAATDFKVLGGVEVGIRCEQPGNILYQNEAPNVRLQIYNPEKKSGELEVEYRIENYSDQPVAQKKVKVALEGKTHHELPIDIPLDRRGIFRVLAWVVGTEDIKDEMVFSVLPPNQNLGNVYPEGHVGSDTGWNAKTLQVLKRANVNWIISKHIGRMEVAQPKLGEYRWFDDELKNAVDAKISVLGQVFVNDPPAYIKPYCGSMAGWEPEKKKKYLEIWGDYVYKLVDHYKGTIRHWEVTNEPYFWCKPEDLADVTRVASDAIRRVDPKIHVIAFCAGNQPGYFQQAIRSTDPALYDGLSAHFYDNNPLILRPMAEVMKRLAKTGWQTEAGPSYPSFYTTLPTIQQLKQENHFCNPSSQSARESLALTGIIGELRCYGIAGVDHYFHYFTRFANATPSEPTRRAGSGKEDVEYDGSLRPSAVARSIAGHFLDGSRQYAEWRGDARVTLCLFDKAGSTVGYAWSTDGRPLELAAPELGAWKVYDWYGNKITIEQYIPLDRYPRYFEIASPPQQVLGWLDRSKVTGVVSVEARLVGVPGSSSPMLKLLARNESQAQQSANIKLNGALAEQIIDARGIGQISLAAGEEKVIDLPLGRLPAYRGISMLTQGDRFSIKSVVEFAMYDAARVKMAEALREDRSRGPAFKYNLIRTGPGNRMSPADFTPSFRVGYDETNLYLMADVTDSVLSPVADRILPGQNDQVHFLIAAPTAERQGSKDVRERLSRVASASDRYVVLAPKADGSAIGELRSLSGATEALPGVQMHKTSTGYQLFATLPWQKLQMACPPAGASMAFSLVAFDADGVNTEHKTEWPWTGGPDFKYEDPAGWGELFIR